jgi:hypothetical protein
MFLSEASAKPCRRMHGSPSWSWLLCHDCFAKGGNNTKCEKRRVIEGLASGETPFVIQWIMVQSHWLLWWLLFHFRILRIGDREMSEIVPSVSIHYSCDVCHFSLHQTVKGTTSPTEDSGFFPSSINQRQFFLDFLYSSLEFVFKNSKYDWFC